jgi:FixJ family two-component response regulator
VNSTPPLIAVVDDEAPVRAMLGRVLRLADYEVVAFGSGEEFLDSLTTRVPACVILDVHMPGLSGFDAAARLRGARREVPIVFITASDDAALDKAASVAGGSVLLRKPFPADTLLAEIDAALRRGDQ